MIDSDPISEGTPNKRRRIDYRNGQKIVTWDSDNDDGDELFDNIDQMQETIPTQPLPQYKRPISQSSRPSQSQSQSRLPPSQPSASKPKSNSIFAQTMASLQSSMPQGTQPTQPLRRQTPLRSSPEVEVLASSPMKPSPARRAVSSAMAPPGTTFRRPGTTATQIKAQYQARAQSQDTLDPSTFDDPPITLHSDDDEDDLNAAGIKPTSFVRGGQGASDSQESASNRLNISHLAYNSRADDMAGAYGASRRPRPKQGGPSRAQPVDEMELYDITDIRERDMVERMQPIKPSASVSELYAALKKKKGNYDDACALLFEEDEEDRSGTKGSVIDLTSSDMESSNKRPLKALQPKAKQDVHATQSIKDKYARPQINRAIKKAEQASLASAPAETEDSPVKPRRRLIKGRKARDDEEEQEPEEDVDEGITLPAEVEISSDSDVGKPAPSASDERLLKFFNECTALALADLANEKETTAELILSHRPFATLDQIREISNTAKKSKRKTIGEKVLDVCEEMWEGYEAVDQLVDKCKELGEPILETMKKWTHGQVKDGELDMTKLDDPHDSGIGTPSSGFSGDDDVVSPKKKKALLKQPSIMSKELIMKDYQITGLNWLNLLWSKKLSCILADDMGLGKTCQVISFLSHLKETGTEGTSLVVVPGSTIENWLREFQRFSPSIQVQAYYGSQAERQELQYSILDTLDDIDVLVTTYDTAVKKEDNSFLRKRVRPRVCVFDEGHMLKNAGSNRHKELSRINADFRLLLTGTPLQNNLQELISLLGFILPDVFANAAENLTSIFKYKATIKDSCNAALLSTQRIQRARAMLTPFILRRKKNQVLDTLPAKHRRVQYCDMVPEQAKLWRSLILQAMNDKTAPPARGRKGAANTPQSVHMTSLRFAALHPLLLRRKYTDAKLEKLQHLLIHSPASEFRDNRPDLVWKYLTQDLKGGDYALHKFCLERADFIPASFQLRNEEWMTASGKIPVLRDMLTTWIEAGSRALIFSQFTTMLDILEAVLETLGISFVRLDGSTKMEDRQVIIDAFTKDEGIKVFMLSTKAGGAGINLAAADKVVILEGGFNPQDEVQAENRAHRVGQEREVEVVRLVTRGTVEEVILRVGEVKLRLDEAVHGEGEGEGQVLVEQGGEEEGEKKVHEMFFKDLEKEGVPEDDEAADVDVAEDEGLGEDVGKETLAAVEEKPTECPVDEDITEDIPKTRGRRAAAKPKVEIDVEMEDAEESEEEAPRARLKRKRELAPNKQASAKKAASQGADIGAMFRKNLRKKGLNVGD